MAGDRNEKAARGLKMLKERLAEQEKVYKELAAGQGETVCYLPFTDGRRGTADVNHKNRLRLTCYLLYHRVDDEERIRWLFEEELKDRKNDSFQGIGDGLKILTWAKGECEALTKSRWYENLYEKAIDGAQVMGDPYEKELAEAYQKWRDEMFS